MHRCGERADAYIEQPAGTRPTHAAAPAGLVAPSSGPVLLPGSGEGTVGGNTVCK